MTPWGWILDMVSNVEESGDPGDATHELARPVGDVTEFPKFGELGTDRNLGARIVLRDPSLNVWTEQIPAFVIRTGELG